MQCIAWSRVVLPIGISFFTFQKMSYIVDVYRGVQPAGSLGTYILYVSLFPQLIAGPIVRYHDIAKQLVKRNHNSNRMFAGIWRFSIGLGKKVLIANSLGELADASFNAGLQSHYRRRLDRNFLLYLSDLFRFFRLL